MAEYRLSTSQTILLIELYHCHDALWDFTNPLYKDRNVKSKSYQSMQMAFRDETGITLPESVIKTKIHSFRTQFTKEKNMIENSKKNGAAPEDVYIPKYEFFQYLLFLEPVIIKRATRPNLDGVQTNTANTEGSQGPQDMQDTLDTLDAEDTKDSLLTIPSPDDVDDMLDNSPSERPSVDVHGARGQGLKRHSSGIQAGLPLLAQLQADGRPGTNGKKRKEDISSKSFLNTLNDYLRDYIDREERRRAEEMRRSEEAEREHAPNMLWARNLAQQIEEIRDEKKRKLLKLKIAQMVNECQMEELQNE